VDIGLGVEPQGGLTWDRFRQLARFADDAGFHSFFRSDHFFTGEPLDALEAFTSLAVAAADTARVRLGTLVTPVMFRPPVEVARMAAGIDQLSGGRFVLGLGIGWHVDEHRTFGVPFPSAGERYERLAEMIQVCRAMWGPGTARFDGRYYRLDDARALPKPHARLPVLIGGTGERRALRLVAEYADEWCSECVSVETYAHKVRVLEQHCADVSRDPATIRRSMVIPGQTRPTVRRAARVAAKTVLSATRVRPAAPQPFEVPRRFGGLLVGGHHQMLDELGKYAALGLQEAILRHDELFSDRFPAYLAEHVVGPAGDL
jgi:F420-dependent oxidoreductase-like protein